MNDNLIGEALQSARRRKGWSQGDAAQRLNVSQGHVSNIERGRSSDPDTTRAYCALLGLNFKKLVAEWVGAISAVEVAITEDAALRDDHRQLLLGLYRAMQDFGPLADVAT